MSFSRIWLCLVFLVFGILAAEEVCYEYLGCFSMEPPWRSLSRPVFYPWAPGYIDTKIVFFSRNSTHGENVILWPNISIRDTGFDPKKSVVFIIHGYRSGVNGSWVTQIKDAYLEKVDANVFLVDWVNGADIINYLRACSNARIVAAELRRFGKFLIQNYGSRPELFHLIGHSLGAHIASYMANGIPGVGRITGLDPAKPMFEDQDKIIKIDSSDAEFVDVIHTGAHSYFPFLGIGLVEPAGDVDFYINGGFQPGCGFYHDYSMMSIFLKDYVKNPYINFFTDFVYPSPCQHSRSIEIYRQSLISNCTFWGHKELNNSATWRKIIRYTLGEKVNQAYKKECKLETCIPIGLDTPIYPARGSFYVSTLADQPYCDEKESRRLQNFSKLLWKPRDAY